jgi:acyl-CoA synthetase (NDP forming)
LGERARRAGKPVIVHKMGNSAAGAEAAATHTGAVAGSPQVYRAAFEQAGMPVVEHFDELLEVADLFVKGGVPRGLGVGVLSASGGAAIVAADEAESAGVPLPPLSPATAATMREVLPGFGSVANPADLTGEAAKDPAIFEQCLTAFRGDDNYDLVIAPLTLAWEATTGPRAKALVAAADGATSGAALAAIWMSEWDRGPGALTLRESSRLVTFRSFRGAMRAAKLWLDWGRRSTRNVSHVADASTSASARVEQGLQALRSIASADTSGPLDELESRLVLDALGVPTSIPRRLDPSTVNAADLRGLAFPVVVKLLSREVTHKARLGGVRLNLPTPEAAVAAAQEIGRTFGDAAPAAVIVEPMVSSRREWFVGARRDPSFGSVLSLGFGGTDVESLEPLLVVGASSAADVLAIITEASTATARALQEAGDVAHGLADVGGLLLQLLAAADELNEVDVNPLLETADGLVAVDGVLVLGSRHFDRRPDRQSGGDQD